MNSMCKWTAVLTALFLMLGPVERVSACGAFFSESATEILDMSDQRTLLVHVDGRVDQYVQVAYTGNPSNFAWIYPFPAQPALTETDNRVFESLDEVTRPKFYIYWESDDTETGDNGCGCGFPGAGDDDEDGAGGVDAGADDTVDVWDSGQVGIFDYVTITANSIDDMLTWLTDNGFYAPENANEVLAHYVSLGWFFVAMKISPQNAQAAAVTTAVRFSYTADTLTYPLYMSSMSAAARIGILIYTLAPGRMQTAGEYITAQIPAGQVVATSTDTTNYESLFDRTLSATNNGRSFVVEYAEFYSNMAWMLNLPADSPEIPGSHMLTRLRTVMSPVAMGADVPFIQAPNQQTISSEFHLDYVTVNLAKAGGGLLLLAALCSGLLRRRKRRDWSV